MNEFVSARYANFHRLLAPMVAVIIAMGVGGAQAASITLSSQDNGWYNFVGYHSTNNTSIFTRASTNRSFFNFDTTALVGTNITSATIVFHPQALYDSPNTSETLTLYGLDLTTPGLASTGNGSPEGLAIYTDLGSGTSYGSHIYDDSAPGEAMREFSVGLNLAAITDIALDSVFSVGGSLTPTFGTPTFSDGTLWSDPSQTLYRDPGAASLIVEYSATAVPEINGSQLGIGLTLLLSLVLLYREREGFQA